MKFTINAKELKEMINRASTIVPKNTYVPSIYRLYFEVKSNGTLELFGTDTKQFATVKTDGIVNTESGMIGINFDELKLITKFTNENLTIETIADNNNLRAVIKNGKKQITLPCYENYDNLKMPVRNSGEVIYKVSEKWLYETFMNLVTFTTDKKEENPMLGVFNFNLTEQNVEVCDGHRITLRKIPNTSINRTENSDSNSVKIPKMAVPVFKKLLDKKSESDVFISQDDKYVYVEGKDFSYAFAIMKGKYFDIARAYPTTQNWGIEMNVKELTEVAQYNADLRKNDSAPMVLHNGNGILHSYLSVRNIESFDCVEVSENTMDDGYYIGFNPHYLLDVLKILKDIGVDKLKIEGTTCKAPMTIEDDEYKFVILPVNIKSGFDYVGKINECIKRNAA